MPELMNETVRGVACDARDCDAQITGHELPSLDGTRTYTARAVDAGWTVWVSRSRRYYCPDHGPSRGHQMDLVAGTPQEATR